MEDLFFQKVGKVFGLVCFVCLFVLISFWVLFGFVVFWGRKEE